jgi:hypothetical protein
MSGVSGDHRLYVFLYYNSWENTMSHSVHQEYYLSTELLFKKKIVLFYMFDSI